MELATPAIEQGRPDQKTEDDEVHQRNDEELKGRRSGGEAAARRMKGRGATDDQDEQSPSGADDAHPAMHRRPVRGDEARLDEEQREPAGHHRSVQLEKGWQSRRGEQRLQVVGPREAGEHEEQRRETHEGIERTACNAGSELACSGHVRLRG